MSLLAGRGRFAVSGGRCTKVESEEKYSLLCMDECEEFDLHHVTNIPAKTLSTVSDVNHRLKLCSGGSSRATLEVGELLWEEEKLLQHSLSLPMKTQRQ